MLIVTSLSFFYLNLLYFGLLINFIMHLTIVKTILIKKTLLLVC